MYGSPIGARPVQLPQPQYGPVPSKPHWLDRLLGGPLAGLLGDSGDPRMQGLLSAGAAMLEASGPSTQRVGLGQVLARGLQAGQQGYANSVTQGLQVQQMQQQRALQKRREELMAGAMQGGEADRPARLQRVFEALLQTGDYEGARSVAEVLKSVGGGQADRKLMEVESGRKVLLVDPVTGQTVRELDAPAQQGTPASRRLVPVQTPQGPRYAEYDPVTGGYRVTDMRPASARVQPTESERKAALLLSSMEFAMPQLDAADAPSRIEMLARAGGLNEALKADQQKNMIAGKVIAEAWLRLTSGAAITDKEITDAAVTMVPLPGDSPATIEYKRQLRKRRQQAIARYAQRATAIGGEMPVERPSLDDLYGGVE